jgi:methionine sulfoxide reductase heme-binding subunit
VAESLAELPWTWVLIRATGVAAWGLLTAVVVWGILGRWLMRGARPAPRTVALHRWLGTLSLILVVTHMGLLLIDPVVPFTVLQILVPLTAPWQPFEVAFGSFAFWLIVPAWTVGRLRHRLGPRWFPIVHTFGYAAWPVATVHYVLAGTDALASWSIGLLIAGTTVVTLALLTLAWAPADSTESV